MVVPTRTLTSTKNFQTKKKRTKQIIKETEDLDLSSFPVRPVVELTTPQRNATLEQTHHAPILILIGFLQKVNHLQNWNHHTGLLYQNICLLIRRILKSDSCEISLSPKQENEKDVVIIRRKRVQQ